VRHDLLVYSDEIYDRLAYGSYRHRAMSALDGMRDRTILMGGFSKAYAMTGWRVGYACAPAAILEGIVKVHQYGIMSAPTTAQDAPSRRAREAEVRSDGRRVRRSSTHGRLNRSVSRRSSRAAASTPSRIAHRPLLHEFAERLLTEERVASFRAAFRAFRRGHVRACYATATTKGSRRRCADRALRPRSDERRLMGAAAPSPSLRATPRPSASDHVQLKTASDVLRLFHRPQGRAAGFAHLAVCLGRPGTLPVINRRAVGSAGHGHRHRRRHAGSPAGSARTTSAACPRVPDQPVRDPPRPRLMTIDTSGPLHGGIRRARRTRPARPATPPPLGSLVDFNRAGVPLLEIVTEPDIRTAEQARRYAEELRLLLRTIDVSDAEMENGQMRVEANVSLRPRGTAPFGIRTEVKNMNSLRAVERAIAFEIERQARALGAGEALLQETRGWDDDRGITYTMRIKEDSDDYRYSRAGPAAAALDRARLESIRAGLPELPAARQVRYRTSSGSRPATRLYSSPTRAPRRSSSGSRRARPRPQGRRGHDSPGYLRTAKGTGRSGATAPAVDGAQLGRLVRHGGRGHLRHERQAGLRAPRPDGEPWTRSWPTLGWRRSATAMR
jgi:aspartyl-tRNA(Asn)/glutamyl-tRNA(Gln) amidotransferase subunit B